jgi:hypothetical protein
MHHNRRHLDNFQSSCYVPVLRRGSDVANKQIQSEAKSAELQAFSHWLRTGWRLPLSAFESEGEQKFNPNHDPTNGRFTSGPGGVSSAQMGRAPAGGAPIRQPQSASPHRVEGGSWHPSVAIGPIAEIPGYPHSGKSSWRRANDLAFSAAADFYNRKYRLKPGDQGFRTPEFMKAWAMRESGGEGNRAAFLSDPFQVNKSGDWVDEKASVTGLRRGQAMSPTVSAYAALEWLRHKSQIRDANRRIIGFRSDQQALERYNANPARAGNVPHYVWYASSILQMASQATSKPK